MLEKNRLRIALQKSGRLSSESYNLLIKCGVKINLQHNQLLAFAENMPIDILCVRDDDIPGLIVDKVVDLGIVGENVLEEKLFMQNNTKKKKFYNLLIRLDFGICRLSLAIPKSATYCGLESLKNKRIASSYPNLVTQFFYKKSIPFKLCILNGSVEVAPRAGLADAICDLVSTGTTLEANDLKEVQTIFNSQACVICRLGHIENSKQIIINKLMNRINGVIKARESKYIMLHAPISKLNEIISLLHGAENPTILKLAGEKNRVAMHMVSSETVFWETMEKLKLLGASSILVLPIEKMLE